MKALDVDWIAVDWGTSHVRAWALDQGGAVLGRAASDQGMSGLKPTEYQPALVNMVQAWLSDRTTPVIACGMVGARQGWIEAAYLHAPCAPQVADRFVQAPSSDARLQVWITPGVAQADPADVMRGEETQIAGFLTNRPDFQGMICLPGTHAKWVAVADGQIQHFTTAMTGEVFALLADQSVLRHTAGQGWNDGAFADAVRQSHADPDALMARLFSVRAEALLADPAPGAARARLSGLLIGAEIAAVQATGHIVLLGDQTLSRHYETALQELGLTTEVVDIEATTLDGLRHAKALLDRSGQ
ncbi:MAG: 2-dehydro-3-deoxygalactonokinase [Pseudomonadota bacterium]